MERPAVDALDDTIVAIASAPGTARRGIVRLSGLNVVACVSAFSVPRADIRLDQLTKPTAVSAALDLPDFAEPVEAYLYVWPTARSYTRQPTIEIHAVGCPPLLAAIVERSVAAGARLARPGEFTLRAFLAGRIDLTQAEAVLGIIDAHSEAAFRVALAQLAGGLALPLAELRESLLGLLAHLEAGLDFVDESIEFITRHELVEQLARAETEVADCVTRLTTRAGRDPIARVVLVGRPNAGKSTLFNRLIERDAAIVADVPGTTRDYLTAQVELSGWQLQLVDTAGVDIHAAVSAAEPRPPSDGIDQSAQLAACEQRQSATLELFCVDASQPCDSWEAAQLADRRVSRLVVWTKGDRAPADLASTSGCLVSAHSGIGLEQLRAQIRKALDAQLTTSADVVPATAERCRTSLSIAATALAQARQLAASGGGDELVALELRAALTALGEVAGTVYTDDLLDRIFSRFCIGK